MNSFEYTQSSNDLKQASYYNQDDNITGDASFNTPQADADEIEQDEHGSNTSNLLQAATTFAEEQAFDEPSNLSESDGAYSSTLVATECLSSLHQGIVNPNSNPNSNSNNNNNNDNNNNNSTSEDNLSSSIPLNSSSPSIITPVGHHSYPPASTTPTPTRPRSTRVIKKRRMYQDDDYVQEDDESPIPLRNSNNNNNNRSHHPHPYRGGRGHHHPMFAHSGPLAKSSLSNDEEFELMDFTLMKRVEEMKVLKEALEVNLISKESFALKQLQFLDSVPF